MSKKILKGGVCEEQTSYDNCKDHNNTCVWKSKYNVIEIDNIYIIHKKCKGLVLQFESPCIIYIIIRDKLFIHYY